MMSASPQSTEKGSADERARRDDRGAAEDIEDTEGHLRPGRDPRPGREASEADDTEGHARPGDTDGPPPTWA